MGEADQEAAALEKVTALFKTESGKGWDEWEVLEMDVQEHLGQPTLGQGMAPVREHKLRVMPAPVLRPQGYLLRVRLPIDPQQAGGCDDRFTLFSTGEEFRQTLSVRDDLVPGDRCVDLEFSGLVSGLIYTLEIDPGREGERYLFFEGVQFADLPTIKAEGAPVSGANTNSGS